jgi:hypothetical protein
LERATPLLAALEMLSCSLLSCYQAPNTALYRYQHWSALKLVTGITGASVDTTPSTPNASATDWYTSIRWERTAPSSCGTGASSYDYMLVTLLPAARFASGHPHPRISLCDSHLRQGHGGVRSGAVGTVASLRSSVILIPSFPL